jgi:hypothetical protein
MKRYSLKPLLIFSIISLIVVSCNLGQSPKQTSQQLMPGEHKVVVKEVIQTTNYTYLFVDEEGLETWLALPSLEAKEGETYYYMGGMEMKNFESKELGRTFPTVYFIESVSKSPDLASGEKMEAPHSNRSSVTDKQAIDIKPAQGGISIAELYQNKASYSGKKVKIKGQVTKFNGNIMDRNWVHIQDGSEFSGKYDLTATTDTEVSVGNIVTLEGVVKLDQDFGYGYSYEILLEGAVLIKEL